MDRNYKISVAMATYNGGMFIKEQLDSILKQLSEDDEIIVSDDGSTDNTLDIIKSYNDKRIKVLDGPHKGVKQNFANAISNCRGKYIFLSDQDDIWLPNKVVEVVKCFEKNNCDCITHNNDVVSVDCSKTIIEDFFKYRGSKSGVISNIIKNRYLGCTMAFRNNMKKYVLPIPNDVEMHDQWIGIMCDRFGKSVFLDKKLIHYRRHQNNASSMHHYPIWKMIKNRVVLIHRILRCSK